MLTRTFVAALAVLLIAAGPASAKSKTETATSGQVTATFSYNYKETRFGTHSFSNLQVTITRAGSQLLQELLGGECNGCEPWPAGGANPDAPSIFARDLDNDGEPEILVDLYTGGANCCFYTQSYRYDPTTDKYIAKVLRPGLSFPYTLKDLNKDKVPEFRTIDYRFAYKYGSNADTPRPLRIFDWDNGKLVDVTLAYPGYASRDAAVYYRIYLKYRKSKTVNVRGFLAAYVASSYNAGKGPAAWRRVVAAFRRGELDKKPTGEVGPFGRDYLISLRKPLKRYGYLRGR